MKRKSFLILVSIFCTILKIDSVMSQPASLMKMNTTASILYDDNTGHIGLGISTPGALFHIRSTSGFLTEPHFKTEVLDAGFRPLGSVKMNFNEGGMLFGIFQESDQSNLFNSFTSTTLIGFPMNFGVSQVNSYKLAVNGKGFFNESVDLKNQINFLFNNDLHGAGITWETLDLDDTFVFTNYNTNTHSNTYPLILDPLSGVTTHGILQADHFRLLDEAGENKVLISDQYGNGIWADASQFHDDDWLISLPHGEGNLKNLYLNPQYQKVGIGTEDPMQALHVCGGNILISRLPDEAPGSLNGSIYFGEVVTNEYPNGEWGIEYYDEGLNFWKVNTNSGPSGNYRLFLQNDGNVGINTDNPIGRFQVNEGFEKFAVGSANSPELGIGTSYIGFNAAREEDRWLLTSNGTANGGAISYGDIEGNYHFVTVPTTDPGNNSQSLSDPEVVDKIRMTISKDGDVGIGTISTHGYKLAVKGKILCENLKVQLEEDWPDHVFDKDYPLLQLNELESYIKSNNHLPGVPTNTEVKEQGINVSEMNSLLIQKIEELTLYIIDQQKKIESQQKQIDELKVQMKTK